MELAAGIFLVVMGCVMLVKPKIIWRVSESWKVENNTGPSNSYINMMRVVGCILVIGGIFAILEI